MTSKTEVHWEVRTAKCGVILSFGSLEHAVEVAMWYGLGSGREHGKVSLVRVTSTVTETEL